MGNCFTSKLNWMNSLTWAADGVAHSSGVVNHPSDKDGASDSRSHINEFHLPSLEEKHLINFNYDSPARSAGPLKLSNSINCQLLSKFWGRSSDNLVCPLVQLNEQIAKQHKRKRSGKLINKLNTLRSWAESTLAFRIFVLCRIVGQLIHEKWNASTPILSLQNKLFKDKSIFGWQRHRKQKVMTKT